MIINNVVPLKYNFENILVPDSQKKSTRYHGSINYSYHMNESLQTAVIEYIIKVSGIHNVDDKARIYIRLKGSFGVTVEIGDEGSDLSESDLVNKVWYIVRSEFEQFIDKCDINIHPLPVDIQYLIEKKHSLSDNNK